MAFRKSVERERFSLRIYQNLKLHLFLLTIDVSISLNTSDVMLNL